MEKTEGAARIYIYTHTHTVYGREDALLVVENSKLRKVGVQRSREGHEAQAGPGAEMENPPHQG